MKKILFFVFVLFVVPISFASKPSKKIDYISKYFSEDSHIRQMYNLRETCCCGLFKSSAARGCDTINNYLHKLTRSTVYTNLEIQKLVKACLPNADRRTVLMETGKMFDVLKEVREARRSGPIK